MTTDQDNARKQLAELRQKETSKSQATSTENLKKNWTGLERAYVLGIFKRFQDLYGNTWTSQMPTEDALESKMSSWAKTLAGVSPVEIGEALKFLPDMPPSAPQFRALCKGSTMREAHKPFPKALPKPKATKEKSLIAISIIKHNLRTRPSPSLEGKHVKDDEPIRADEVAMEGGHKHEKRKAQGFMTEDGKPIQ